MLYLGITLSLLLAISIVFTFFAFFGHNAFLLVTSIAISIFSFFLLIFGMIFLTFITSITQIIVNFALYQYAKKGDFPEHFKGSNMILEAV